VRVERKQLAIGFRRGAEATVLFSIIVILPFWCVVLYLFIQVRGPGWSWHFFWRQTSLFAVVPFVTAAVLWLFAAVLDPRFIKGSRK
jgi:hypothetical protein